MKLKLRKPTSVNDWVMFYYLSIITYIALAPLNVPVTEKSVTGLFPDQYLCETYKFQVEELIRNVRTAKLTTSKCVKELEV